MHIAAAAVAECEFLLTWNFRHIANVRIRREVEKILANHGYTKTTICTPEVPRSTDMIWTGSLRISKTVKRKVAFAGPTKVRSLARSGALSNAQVLHICSHADKILTCLVGVH